MVATGAPAVLSEASRCVTFFLSDYSGAMQRRACLVVMGGFPAWARSEPQVLSLYGLALKDATVDAFVAAARAVGATPLPTPFGTAAALDVRAVGVPALQRLVVTGHDGRVAQVEFTVKAYGEDNLALRQLLLEKYGAPLTESARPLPFGGFGSRSSPRGGFQWRFDDGLRLVYTHPTIGDATLRYVDDARMAQFNAPAAPADLRNRF